MTGITTLKLSLARKHHLSMLTTCGEPSLIVSWSASALVAIHLYVTRCDITSLAAANLRPETVTRLSGWLSSDDVTILSYVVIGGLVKRQAFDKRPESVSGSSRQTHVKFYQKFLCTLSYPISSTSVVGSFC